MEQIGPYQIQGELGRGGMGIVYRGLDPVIGRTVAVKTVHAADLGDPVEQEKLKERLFREAKSAGILSHPNIVTIYQAGQDNDVLFIAMEFIDGPNLAEALARTRPGVALTLDLLKQAAEALDYAHSKGVVHRDIKPGNLLLQSEGKIKVADFGIAKLAATNLTKTGTTVGSPAYMSPEQIRGSQLDGRADQYSLAIVAYEMFTGLRPYDSDTITTLVFKIVFEQPDLSRLEGVPGGPAMEPVFRKAFSKGAEDRYPSCSAFWQALSDAVKGAPPPPQFDSTIPMPSLSTRPIVTPPVERLVPDQVAPPIGPVVKSRSSSSGLIIGASVVALLAAAGGAWMWTHREPPVPVVATSKDPGATTPVDQTPPAGTPDKVSQPVLLKSVDPEYTPQAKAAHIEGSVELRIGIDEHGQVVEPEVLKSLDPGLDQKAIEAVKKWKFQPAMVRGKPVAIHSRAELNFHMAR